MAFMFAKSCIMSFKPTDLAISLSMLKDLSAFTAIVNLNAAKFGRAPSEPASGPSTPSNPPHLPWIDWD